MMDSQCFGAQVVHKCPHTVVIGQKDQSVSEDRQTGLIFLLRLLMGKVIHVIISLLMLQVGILVGVNCAMVLLGFVIVAAIVDREDHPAIQVLRILCQPSRVFKCDIQATVENLCKGLLLIPPDI